MNVALVVAGGQGRRFGVPGGKQLLPVAGRPLLAWTLKAMEDAARIDAVVVTFDPARLEELSAALREWEASKVRAVVAGGDERQDSVRSGLASLPCNCDVVAVHDGARPLVSPQDVDACVEALPGFDGAVLGRPVVDTIKEVGAGAADTVVERTLDRGRLWQAETPQVFPVDVLRRAHERAQASGVLMTDDAAVVELAGGKIRMVAATGLNTKVTVKEDAVLAEAVLARRIGA